MGFNEFLSSIFGNKSTRDMKEIKPWVEKIKAAYPEIEALDNDALRAKTEELKKYIRESATDERAKVEELKASIESTELEDREEVFAQIDKIEKEILEKYEKALEEVLPVAFSIVKATAKRFTENEEIVVTATEFDRHLAATKDFVRIEGDKAIYQNHWNAGGNDTVWNMIHYDVQLFGGVVLHKGKIAEMATGEGKTLVATLPVFLNALTGNGVHVVTVNDYLAKRDSEWMGPLYMFHGLSVDCIDRHQPNSDARRQAYLADITFGTNNEFGFDYLRDNMAISPKDLVQRQHNYAIVDEVDSVLIDDARTPLIISGPAEGSTDIYVAIDKIPDMLERQKQEKGEGDYWVDEKQHTVQLSEAGHEKVEKIMVDMGLLPAGQSLYSPTNIMLLHYLNAALRAHTLFVKDQHYVVQNGEVIIVDEFTGRLMKGRRWSDGLHQAVEAKEGVEIQQENQTFASITFQNYFRMYEKLSGMTGTADTEAYEFQEIYGLETVVIPTHRMMIRDDQQDKVYRTAKEKYKAIVDDVKECYGRGQPVLVGTTSIENSELISDMLTKAGIPHNVLNAKQHEREAQIVMEAGRPGMVTIATNMAGRGTDIVLGGGISKALEQIDNDETLSDEQKKAQKEEIKAKWQVDHDRVVELGGLRIIGSERHESRRIDNQLRGRSGRQGDPGSSRFYLSMEDPLLRIFAGEKMQALMNKLRLPEGEAIEAGIVSRSIETAQRKVESRNFDIRKQLLEYDDVANDQRKEIYALRNEILENKDVSGPVKELRDGYFTSLFRHYVPADTVEEQWDLEGLEKELKEQWNLDVPLKATLEKSESSDDQELLDMLLAATNKVYDEKVALVGHEAFAQFERNVLLQFLDQRWREHLSQLDMLRQGIYLRGYAQKQPKQEYKREAFELFANLLETVGADVTRVLMNVQIRQPEPEEVAAAQQEAQAPAQQEALSQEEDPFAHVGRNDPCPCGSGKKFKDCHGKLR